MGKRVYISADYAWDSGDRDVAEVLQKWGQDNIHRVDFVDMSQVNSGSVASAPDCRPCDLKEEFNRQINASSAVIFVIGDKTAGRTAGSTCSRIIKSQYECSCTPYKQNTNGTRMCKVYSTYNTNVNNVSVINSYSYLRHEFEQAKKARRKIIIVYNSLRCELGWFPSYMKGYENIAHPFWKRNYNGEKVGDYDFIKRELGF